MNLGDVQAHVLRGDETIGGQPSASRERLSISATEVPLWDVVNQILTIGTMVINLVQIGPEGGEAKASLRRNDGGANKVLQRTIMVEPGADSGLTQVVQGVIHEPNGGSGTGHDSRVHAPTIAKHILADQSGSVSGDRRGGAQRSEVGKTR